MLQTEPAFFVSVAEVIPIRLVPRAATLGEEAVAATVDKMGALPLLVIHPV